MESAAVFCHHESSPNRQYLLLARCTSALTTEEGGLPSEAMCRGSVAKELPAPGSVLQLMQFRGVSGELPYNQYCDEPAWCVLLPEKSSLSVFYLQLGKSQEMAGQNAAVSSSNHRPYLQLQCCW